MFWLKLSLFLFGWLVTAQQQQQQLQQQQLQLQNFRKLLLLQPGPGAADGGLRISSISTRRGAAGRPSTYNLELNASYGGGQVRTRRMGQQQQQQQQQRTATTKPSGVNVCGGQCCHGWSQAQGSQRCTKPNCIPQCQNGGMCLRPQLCVCKSGSTGKACEEKSVHTPPFPALAGSGPSGGGGGGQHTAAQRPIPQQMPSDAFAPSHSSRSVAQMKLTVRSSPQLSHPHYIQQHIQQQIQAIQPGQTQQYYIKHPKYYHTHSTQRQTQVQPDRPLPLTAGFSPIQVGNHTGRIKVVFTPTICKLTCMGGRCHNNCKQGNTTTIISENGRASDTLTAPNFRVVVCHLPCVNGGKCSSRDKCHCPPSFTGKFCQMPVHSGQQQQQQQQQQQSGGYTQTQVHSKHTLPLTYSHSQNPAFSPNIVNVHVNHPPEASVQVHQVSQLDNYRGNGQQQAGGSQQMSSSSSNSYSYHHTESSQKIQHSYNIVFPGQNGYHTAQYQQPVSSKDRLGRCFQETAGVQCGKALPGLTKQEQCCGSIGTSWGFHKCQKCPNKPSIPLVDCPQGYKRVNASHCQDVDECQIHGVCLNGRCLNTIGSFRCLCNSGFMPDPSLTSCISLFKEICPGGMGYTVLPNPPANRPAATSQEPVDLQPPRLLPTAARPVEAFEVVERSSPPAPVEVFPSNAGQDIGPTQAAEVDECQISPYICGQGVCYNTAEGYTCHCDEGYRLDEAQSTCIDADECQDAQLCSRGHCHNTEGSFSCQCAAGFRVSSSGDQCEDVDECSDEANLCSPHGQCSNTEGSYQCVCDSGFTANLDTPTCDDIDECGLNETLCGAHGYCENRLGSFRCLCDPGYQEAQDSQHCVDVNECELSSVCGEAQCVNVGGSFFCTCPSGQNYNVQAEKCEPTPTAPPVERKECYYNLNDENLCESVLTSHVTLQECCCTLGAGWGDNCEVHPCPVNGTDQFKQMCPSGKGYVLSGDATYEELTAESYRDADECTLFGDEVCKGGFCRNTAGSYECYCQDGHIYDLAKLECTDTDECVDESLCVGGQCVNTDGSYVCFCTHPMVLDPSSNHCVFFPEVLEEDEDDASDYQGICWQSVGEEMMCTRPLVLDRKFTFTECCCLYGEAWGMKCAMCPPRNSAYFAEMCNLSVGDSRRPYGRDALNASPTHRHQVDSQPSEHQGRVDIYDTRQHGHEAFEGLQAEECGILNGCENGRCVRVQEGYTCDCFDGFTLDLARMACVDVNECSELNNRMVLCKNAECINTLGSYRCVCLPGFTSARDNYCVEASTTEQSSARPH
ncbi:latent-transforming growth factor beta-binding protein 1 isoform X2 [Nelusetta ayraudi]|uniref:latent-transforming growth factor beta-binding protein 1 isoform X2 n=1 Tax=Nelusetta ayraudi TaxID=303726 RepID=UPI003F73023A